MSGKSSPANEGIVNSGNGNVQTAGKTNYAESKWTVSAPPKGMDKVPGGRIAIPPAKVPGGRIAIPLDNKGIISKGHGNVQAAGETHYGSSQWTIK